MANDPLIGKVLADRFEILSRIGEGGSGVVYKARQLNVDREVAIKVLGAHVASDPQWVRRFQNEGKAAAKLSSPHTVRFIDSGQTTDGLFYIAMELLEGRSVRDELDKLGRLPPGRALRIIAQACRSVGEAHQNGIIHRDLKPDNLYLHGKGAEDFVKVLDFGVAKIEGSNNQTSAGMALGTPQYMSPEQARGGKLGPESDIYALGVVLYEALSGGPPFDSKIPTEVIIAHIKDAPPPMTGVPEAVSRLVMKALEKSPDKRYRTCEAFAQAAEGVLAELYPQLTPPSGIRAAATPPAGVPLSAPPPAAAPSAAPMHSAPVEARTMIGEMLPPSARPAPGLGGAVPLPANWAGAVDRNASARTHGPNGTLVLPDSQGVIAFALDEVKALRQRVALERAKKPEAAPWTFWAGWAVLGLGLGVLGHFVRLKSGGG